MLVMGGCITGWVFLYVFSSLCIRWTFCGLLGSDFRAVFSRRVKKLWTVVMDGLR